MSEAPGARGPTFPYQPRPLAKATDDIFRELVQAGKQRRLVLYVGAGLSSAPPASGPSGEQVANHLRPHVARLLGVDLGDIAHLRLEELAERVQRERPEEMDDIRHETLNAFDFRDVEPNYGHQVAALLLREGVVELISANWDCGVERAGLRAGIRIRGVATAAERLGLVQELPVYKVHGCARQPLTLALTQAEIDEPQRWAFVQVQNALTGGVVVFVGLGTVGLYVQDPFSELLDLWTELARTVWVVDRELRQSWRDALNFHAAEAHISMEADDFMDELLRTTVLDALDEAGVTIDLLAAEESWAEAMRQGFQRLREALSWTTGDAVLRWWRDGVVETQDGKPFVSELPGQRCIMTVAQLAGLDALPIGVDGAAGALTIANVGQYFEVLCRPGDLVSAASDFAREWIERRDAAGVYEDRRLVTAVIADAVGTFPSPDAIPDVAASSEDAGDMAGAVSIRIVSAEDGVRGVLAA